MDDLEQTGISELERPQTRGFDEWEQYFKELYEHDSVTKRVKWPCCKCGKVFYAHCGLDIASSKNLVKQA
jgi:hypothetical protein